MTVQIDPAARRALDRLRRRDRPAAQRVDQMITVLAEDPHPPGSKWLGGDLRACRLSSGKLRVLYLPTAPVKVVAVGYRRSVYGSRSCSN
ncbi:type II toxin-antitoxin system RelE/ParE family toxin [Streptomyces sp. NPDC096033]|uniref:type II toxin-antitoxin system RelE family toxin n=1 Tax=Streptomyces sp. NPDC096033 TaxID=3366071 RepID=UPI0037F93177